MNQSSTGFGKSSSSGTFSNLSSLGGIPDSAGNIGSQNSSNRRSSASSSVQKSSSYSDETDDVIVVVEPRSRCGSFCSYLNPRNINKKAVISCVAVAAVSGAAFVLQYFV